MSISRICLPCDDGCATLVVLKTEELGFVSTYEVSIQNSYFTNENARNNICGRLKRAWKVFTEKPIYYNDIVVSEENIKCFSNELMCLIDE